MAKSIYPTIFTVESLIGKLHNDSLGIIYRRRTNLSEILKEEKLYDWCASYKPTNKSILYIMGCIHYYHLKDLTKAMTCYTRAANVGDSNSMAMLGKIYKECGNIDKAVLFSTKAAEWDNSYGYVYLGILHEKTKLASIEKAMGFYQMAVKKDNPDGYWHYVLLYSQLNELDEPKFKLFVSYLLRASEMYYSDDDKNDCYDEIHRLLDKYPQFAAKQLITCFKKEQELLEENKKKKEQLKRCSELNDILSGENRRIKLLAVSKL